MREQQHSEMLLLSLTPSKALPACFHPSGNFFPKPSSTIFVALHFPAFKNHITQAKNKEANIDEKNRRFSILEIKFSTFFFLFLLQLFDVVGLHGSRRLRHRFRSGGGGGLGGGHAICRWCCLLWCGVGVHAVAGLGRAALRRRRRFPFRLRTGWVLHENTHHTSSIQSTKTKGRNISVVHNRGRA